MLLLYLGSDKVSGVAGSHQQPVVGSQLLGKTKVTDVQGLGRRVHIRVEQV